MSRRSACGSCWKPTPARICNESSGTVAELRTVNWASPVSRISPFASTLRCHSSRSMCCGPGISGSSRGPSSFTACGPVAQLAPKSATESNPATRLIACIIQCNIRVQDSALRKLAATVRHRSMAALHEKSGVRQRLRELRLDAGGFGSLDVLQVHRRPCQHLKAAPEHAARRADAGLVLIEASLRGVPAHPDINTMRVGAAVAVIQKYEIDVRAAASARLKARRDLINQRQPIDVAHGKPGWDGLRSALPQGIE